MSNAKIISMIDAEVHAVRRDVNHAIAAMVAEAVEPLVQKVEQLQQRVKKLEEGVPIPLNN
jgi:ubiquinone biosynthesis protein UbiJ